MKTEIVKFIIALLLGIPGLASAQVSVTVLNTGEIKTLEAFTFAGGRWTQAKILQHPGYLIQHNEDIFLFDGGLGKNAKEEFSKDMLWWAKPLMSFKQLTSMFMKVAESPIKPKRIILSHLHFDHLSGALDFKDLEIWTTKEEYEDLQSRASFSYFPSMNLPNLKLHFIEWAEVPYMGYPKSLDLYGDGKVVLVPSPGHSRGSISMFVKLDSGKTLFFVGDSLWNRDAVKTSAPKFFISRKMVDSDPGVLEKEIQHIHDLAKENPNLIVVPTHDPYGGLKHISY